MASSSSSKRARRVPASERNANPIGWISDGAARERFMGWKNVKKVVPHKSLELSMFRCEGFIFPEKLIHQRLSTFVLMKGDCYPELVYSDEKPQTKDKDEVSDSDSEPISFSPKSEFERFGIHRFKKTFKKTGKMKKSIMRMEKKMDEIIKNYVDSSTKTEESTNEDDVSSEEDSMEMSKLE
ncbi:hypothetical protein LR48_Vigan04g120600 [Vigna angularis]|uniref:Uncharacterized protein n=1 Tax=Phaseolus angularis TaxID=3914 RepID=A0A0L9UE50_PHAAN|nr:hypothetical protein LR48_Vigan04g120600 [Vigna angularis]